MESLGKSLFLIPILILVTITYAYADNMQGSSMMHENSTMNGENMSHGTMNGGNMSGWGNNTMMKGESMMTSGGIDTSMGSPVEGSSNAPVTIVEFGDYQCPKCDAWFKNEEPAIKTSYIDTNKTKLYFVDFPFLGADSVTAAQAAYCAGDQGKYWQYHDYLYQNQGSVQSGWASATNLKSYAATLGLDANQFNMCLDSGKYASQVSHNKDVGTSHGVQGTPAFFIIAPNGTVNEILGPQPATAFSPVIDSSLQAVPEFGSIAALVLVIAVISVIAVSAKTRLPLNRKY